MKGKATLTLNLQWETQSPLTTDDIQFILDTAIHFPETIEYKYQDTAIAEIGLTKINQTIKIK
jgi:hypothetical protein